MANWWDSLIPSAGVNISGNPYAGGLPSGISGLNQYNLGGQNLGQYQGLTQAGINNPYAGGYQQGAGVAGGWGQQGGAQQFGAGAGLIGESQGFQPDVQSLLAMGFDPQNALYARTQQQVQDQANAQAASSGVGGTPYGQGVANQANQNFNIDWQNNQLQRAATGAAGASGLATTGANIAGAGAQLEGQGVNSYMMGSSLPYSTYAGINQGQLGLLNQANQYGQGAAQIPEQQNTEQLQFMQQQGQFQNQQQGLQLQQAQQEFQQAQALGQDVAGIAGMGAGIPGMGMGGGGFGGGGYGGGGFGGGGYGGFGGGGGYGGGGQFMGQGFGGGWSPWSGGGFGSSGFGGNFAGYQPSGAYQYQGGQSYPGFGWS
jgi:hypothetical protein